MCKVQRHRLQHPLLEPLKYKLASLVFHHGLFLQHFFLFCTLIFHGCCQDRGSPGPPPSPSHLVQSPGSSSLLFPFYFPDQTLAPSTPSLPHWLLWPVGELVFVSDECPRNLFLLALPRPSVPSTDWAGVFLILTSSAFLLGVGLQ